MNLEIEPKLLEGRIVELTEMSTKIEMKGKMGIVHLPLRSVFTNKPLEIEDKVKLFISYAQVIE